MKDAKHDADLALRYGIVAGLAAVGIAFSLILLATIYETARQIERFDDYKAEFEQRWDSSDE